MEIKIRARQCGLDHEVSLQIKKALEGFGECGVGLMQDPTDMLKRLKILGVDAIAEPSYRTMPPMIKKNEFGEPIDIILGEKVKTGYVFKLNKGSNVTT